VRLKSRPMEEIRGAPPGPIAAAGPPATSPPPAAPAAAVDTEAGDQAAVEQRRRQARELAAQLLIAQQQVRASSSYEPMLAPPPAQEEEEEDDDDDDDDEYEAPYPIDIATEHIRTRGADEASLKKLRAKPCKALRIALGEAPGKDSVVANRAAIVRLLAGRSLDEATTAAGLHKARALKPERERVRKEKRESSDDELEVVEVKGKRKKVVKEDFDMLRAEAAGITGEAVWSKLPLGSAPPARLLMFGGTASSGRAWRLRAARHSQEEAGPLGAQPLPRVLEWAASKAADFGAFLTTQARSSSAQRSRGW